MACMMIFFRQRPQQQLSKQKDNFTVCLTMWDAILRNPSPDRLRLDSEQHGGFINIEKDDFQKLHDVFSIEPSLENQSNLRCDFINRWLPRFVIISHRICAHRSSSLFQAASLHTLLSCRIRTKAELTHH